MKDRKLLNSELGRISPERYSSYLGMIEEDRKFR